MNDFKVTDGDGDTLEIAFGESAALASIEPSTGISCHVFLHQPDLVLLYESLAATKGGDGEAASDRLAAIARSISESADLVDTHLLRARLLESAEGIVAISNSLGSVVEPKGGESGASVPAPAVPMEGEPGPGVQLGPARASMVQELAGAARAYGHAVEHADPETGTSSEVERCWEALRRAAEAYGAPAEGPKPSRWLPPNASDTHAPAPRLACASCGARGTLLVDDDDRLWCEDHKGKARFSVGQATMAGYPEPWEDDTNGC